MASKDVPLNVQVPLGAGGSIAGYGIGKVLAIILFYYVLSPDTPEHVKTAWEILFEAGLGAGGAYLLPWLKGPPVQE